MLPVAVKASEAYADAQGALQEELTALRNSSDNTAERGSALLASQLKRQMPDARQCFQCGFGPIDHYACADFAAHHGQQIGETRIDNSCPKCGWFSAHRNDWPVWDGTLHSDAKLDAASARDLITSEAERTVAEAMEAKKAAEAAVVRADERVEKLNLDKQRLEEHQRVQRQNLLDDVDRESQRRHKEREARKKAEAEAEAARARAKELEGALEALRMARVTGVMQQREDDKFNSLMNAARIAEIPHEPPKPRTGRPAPLAKPAAARPPSAPVCDPATTSRPKMTAQERIEAMRLNAAKRAVGDAAEQMRADPSRSTQQAAKAAPQATAARAPERPASRPSSAAKPAPHVSAHMVECLGALAMPPPLKGLPQVPKPLPQIIGARG